ncbi:MAG: hypothetical protein K6A69_10175 [Lachnospiraceae bacterium]|nr:hypothetical protein [Lachnospiraceae bacterium]
MNAKKIKSLKGCTPEYLFLEHHPEFYTMKNLLYKTTDGKMMFIESFVSNARSYYNPSNAMGIKLVVDKNKIHKFSDEEVEAYEKSLKDRKMPYYLMEGDPYGIETYKSNLDTLMQKDEDGDPIYENGIPKMKSILNIRKVDPITGEPTEED